METFVSMKLSAFTTPALKQNKLNSKTTKQERERERKLIYTDEIKIPKAFEASHLKTNRTGISAAHPRV